MSTPSAPLSPAAETGRPAPGEYSTYYAPYIAALDDGDIREILAAQASEVAGFFERIPADRARHRYAEGKWSVREVIGHMCDAERIMSYRLLRFARGDATPLAGFDENAYVPASNAESRSMAELVAEFRAVRAATVALVQSLPPGAWLRQGIANEAPASVRALGWIIAGHAAHHVRVLQERYLR